MERNGRNVVFAVGGIAVIRLAVILTILTALTAGAWTQEMLMRKAYGVRGASGALVIGNAVDLDGSTEYLSDSSTTLLNGATSCTFSIWCNPAVMPNDADQRGIMGSYYAGAAVQTGIRFYGNRGSAPINVFSFGIATSPNYSFVAGANNSVSTGVWHHVVGTWAMAGSIVLYVNSSALSNPSSSNSASQNSTTKIGWENISPAFRFNGLIDEAAIFKNRVLTASEVAELYNGGVGKPVQNLSTGTNGLVRLWHLDESGSATNAYDSASGTYAIGSYIGTGDWVPGKVPQ
jgi:hypothetical protein